MEGTVTISIKDFDNLRHSDEMLKGLIGKLKSCSEVECLGKGECTKVYLKVSTDKVEKLLREYNTAESYIDHIAWNKQVSQYFEDTQESIEKSLEEGYRYEQLTSIVETLKQLDDLDYAGKTLEQLTGGKIKDIEDLLFELQEELGCISED